MLIQVADPVFLDYVNDRGELEFHFHLTSSQPLSVGKSSQRILVKNPKSKEIEPSHTFSINEVSLTFLPPCKRTTNLCTLSQLRSRITNTQSFAGVHLAVPPSEDPAGKCQGWRGGAGEERDQEEGELLPLMTIID